jgi:hypothetical protein
MCKEIKGIIRMCADEIQEYSEGERSFGSMAEILAEQIAIHIDYLLRKEN